MGIEATPQGLAYAVKEALSRAGIPQRQASELSGIPMTTLSRRLNGSSSFRTDELWALARISSTTVVDLYLAAEHVGAA